MGMHGVVPGCKVLQVNHNNIINLSSQYRTQKTQPAGSWSEAGEGGICILSVHGLLIDTAHTIRPFQKVYRCRPETQMNTKGKMKKPGKYRHVGLVRKLGVGSETNQLAFWRMFGELKETKEIQFLTLVSY